MRGYRGTEATRRHSATSAPCAALMPAARPVQGLGQSVALLDERIEGTSAKSGNHQWKPNALVEPPV